jgi:dUTP pyrophosphatase
MHIIIRIKIDLEDKNLKIQMNCELSLYTTNSLYTNYLRNERKDCGYDIYTEHEVIIAPGQVGTLTFDLKCEARDPYGPVSYFLLPRSSISNTPLMMCNSIGLIDSGYRGTIMAKVRNMGSDPYTVTQGTRLFQLAPMSGHGWYKVTIVDELSETERGDGGFGSTGV